MKKYTAVEWQSFSLKKDIERIQEKLSSSQGIQLTIFAEIALVILGVAFTNVFDDSINRFIWIAVSIICVIIVLIPIGGLLVRYIKRKRKDISVREFRDVFDNEVSYYAMMSESYCSMLNDLFVKEWEAPYNMLDDLKRFYFIEASYYMNKAILELNPIYRISKKVLSNNKSDIVSKRCISYARFYNICNLLETLIDYIESNVKVLDKLDDKDSIIDTNAEYKEILERIKRAVKDSQ